MQFFFFFFTILLYLSQFSVNYYDNIIQEVRHGAHSVPIGTLWVSDNPACRELSLKPKETLQYTHTLQNEADSQCA